MKKINLAITGCMGRMGQQLIKSATKDKSIKLVNNCFNFELDLRNAGRTNIKTSIKDIAGTIS